MNMENPSESVACFSNIEISDQDMQELINFEAAINNTSSRKQIPEKDGGKCIYIEILTFRWKYDPSTYRWSICALLIECDARSREYAVMVLKPHLFPISEKGRGDGKLYWLQYKLRDNVHEAAISKHAYFFALGNNRFLPGDLEENNTRRGWEMLHGVAEGNKNRSWLTDTCDHKVAWSNILIEKRKLALDTKEILGLKLTEVPSNASQLMIKRAYNFWLDIDWMYAMHGMLRHLDVLTPKNKKSASIVLKGKQSGSDVYHKITWTWFDYYQEELKPEKYVTLPDGTTVKVD